jgi:uncharacterized protein (DUF2336 family)
VPAAGLVRRHRTDPEQEVDMPAPAIERAAGGPHGATGRRRAQLVQGIAQQAPAGLSRADVEALRSDPSPDARAALAAKFGRQYDSLVEGETRSLAEAVLQLLVRDLELKVRQTLAETLAASPKLPAAIASRLAHDDIVVARPVLEQSPVLGDAELGEIVRTHAMQYALAVAGREHLSELLSDALAEVGDGEVVARLVGNAGAKISLATLQRVAADYREDAGVQERLIRRPALPYELVNHLVEVIGQRLEWDLVRTRRMGVDEARQLMAATRERATLSIVAREHGERSMERELRRRLSEGGLGPEEVLGFLRDGDIGRVEASFVLLADLDLARTRQLLYGMDKRGLAVMCARAGFGTPHYVALRMVLDLAEQGLKGEAADAGYAEDTLRFIQEQYQRIQADPDLIAQWLRA